MYHNQSNNLLVKNMSDEIPWALIESDYRAGALAISEISRAYGVSVSRINTHAKKNAWSRDLTRDVQEATAKKLYTHIDPDVDPDDDEAVINAASAAAMNVVKLHRNDIQRGREVCMKILAELEEATENPALISELIEEVQNTEKWDKRKSAIANRVATMGARAAMMRDLATATKTLQGLERTAWNLDAKSIQDEDPLTSLLKRITSESSNALQPSSNTRH